MARSWEKTKTGEGYNFQKLRAHILPLSSTSGWKVAAKEWSLTGIFEADQPETCICGHFPILEICTIYNRLTIPSGRFRQG